MLLKIHVSGIRVYWRTWTCQPWIWPLTPASCWCISWKAMKQYPIIRFLPPAWETWIEIPSFHLGLSHRWSLVSGEGEWTNAWEPALFQINQVKQKHNSSCMCEIAEDFQIFISYSGFLNGQDLLSFLNEWGMLNGWVGCIRWQSWSPVRHCVQREEAYPLC